jgi:hypothetical protein
MSGRTSTEEVAQILPNTSALSLSEVRRIIQDAVDLLKVSREDAIQQIMVDALIVQQRPPSSSRTPSHTVGEIVGGIENAHARVILNYAHLWNQEPVDQLLSGGALSDLDEDRIRAETFARDLNIDIQQAERILRIAREEAARTHQ